MKKTILCFGDSNTHGYNPATGGRYDDTVRYPGLLQNYLGSGYLVREEGLSGRTAVFDDPLFEGLNGLTAIFSCMMTHEPLDLLIIMLGTNDTKERFGCSAANIGKGLERLVRKAQSVLGAWNGGIPHILLVTPLSIEDGYKDTSVFSEMGCGCAEKSRALSFYFAQTAELTGCHFLDAGRIPGMSMHPNDCMHLTEKSHDLLADALAKWILSFFAADSFHA